jgi:hypothetical protein
VRAAWLALASLALLPGCKKEGCLAGDEATCRVPTPCPKLAFPSCAVGAVEVRVLRPGDAIAGGPNALGAPGDLLLGNDRVVAVIDALDNPNYLATSGGNLLDLGTRGGDDDNLNQILEGVGILPGDQARWESLEIVEAGPEVAAVQVRGALDGRPRVKVATRYEVRRCEPGIRIRTEVVNLGTEHELWAVFDGYWWGDREVLPFTPGREAGFRHASFDLDSIDDAFQRFPFLAGSGHAPPSISYAAVACNVEELHGFNSTTVSAAGLEKRIVPPLDHAVFERFIAAVPAGDVAGAAAVALEVRRQLFGERFVTLRGRLVRPGGAAIPGEAKAAVVASETPWPGAAPQDRTPWSQALPAPDGSYALTIPADRRYLLEAQAFGRTVASTEVQVASADVDAGTLDLPMVGQLEVTVSDGAGQAIDARVVLVPADSATAAATSGSLYGASATCTPLLGPPHGPSPACNQVLARGSALFDVPSGSYHVYATAGPFATLAHRAVTVAGDRIALDLQVDPLPLLPAGTLSADLHVHGRVSFDSAIPDDDRVLAFAAAGTDVIAATDHDVVGSYDLALDVLGLRGRVAVMSGVETTGEIPWFTIPGSVVPRVIGHWNFWPVAYDPATPRRGAPWDERVEPGVLFERMRPLLTGQDHTGVIEMNHPWYEADFGRDQGWPRALELNITQPLPARDDGTTRGMFMRTPPGATIPNDAYHAQEVMNGSQNRFHLPYRALWFWMLDQGRPRAGTANSDSHGLTDSVLGTPRNLVWAATTPGAFDPDAFNAAIRQGRLLGTNGPVIEASIDSGGQLHLPGVAASFSPAAGASLRVKVSAAPWVPVREVRIVVNGRVAWSGAPPVTPGDPFGATDLTRLDRTFALAELLEVAQAGGRDAWVVIEAGEPLQLAADLDGDGIPDTGDNDGNGMVDRLDVAADEDVGPLEPPPAPGDFADPRFHFAAVSQGGLPQAFTNPFLLDRDGDGRFSGPGLPGARP